MKITYDTKSEYLKIFNFYNNIKYKFLRPILSDIYFYFYYLFFYKRNELSKNGDILKNGISVYIPVKNEESFLMVCLESLLDVANQFILIDNGSTDRTLEILLTFKKKYDTRVEIDVIEMPDSLLVEVVQKALGYVRYRWVLKWDGDMFCINDTKDSLIGLKQKVLKTKRPSAFILPRINLCGDFFHTHKNYPVIDKGEPFLRTVTNKFVFTEEFGRLEHAVIPLYYKLINYNKICSFHFSRIRPIERILYRDIYLDWRETFNNGNDFIKQKYKTLEDFKSDWINHNFETINNNSVYFRAGRLFAQMCIPFDQEKIRKIPEEILLIIQQKKQKFSVEYKDEMPYRIIEIDNINFNKYKPTEEDLLWIPDLNKYLSDNIRLLFVKKIFALNG